MWHNIQDKTPNEEQKDYVVWLRNNRTNSEFWHPCTWYDKHGFIVQGSMQPPEDYGWEIVAWFELPPYRSEA